jgi:hypothetical protein
MRAAIGGLIEKWRDLGHDLGFGIGIAHGLATLSFKCETREGSPATLSLS